MFYCCCYYTADGGTHSFDYNFTLIYLFYAVFFILPALTTVRHSSSYSMRSSCGRTSTLPPIRHLIYVLTFRSKRKLYFIFKVFPDSQPMNRFFFLYIYTILIESGIYIWVFDVVGKETE